MAADERQHVPWYVRGSVRLRTTVLATVVVAIAMGIGSVVLVNLLRHSLVDGLENPAEQRIASVESALQRGESAKAIASGGEDDDEFVQIIDADGRVLASSLDTDDGPAAAVSEGGIIDVGGDGYLVSREDVRADDAELTVVVGLSTEEVDESTATTTRLLVVGVPVLVALVGVATWFVVGRAFSPVDRIRREVDEITGADLGRRVSAPPQRDEIGLLARTMNRMLERLDEAQRRQRQFVSDASHELRSPTASLRQHAEVALSYPDRVTADDLAENVLAESIRVQRIVDALLLLARLDERSQAIASAAVDLDDLLLIEARRLRDTTTLTVDTSGVRAARVRGDENLLARVVRNLTDNAARHASSTVRLSLRSDDTDVVLEVEDDGSGIPEAERERVFERFVRLDEARTRDNGGSGLGLAIVRELVHLHGGSVDVGDGALGGARFEARLPT
ncbi:MAG: ATP-binding protein [Nocardioidaceae bacterium]